MNERAAELKAEVRRGGSAGTGAVDERAVLAKIAEMAPSDRALAERVHAIVTTAAPELSPKLWYGQPAYARAGKVVCFFRSGQDSDSVWRPISTRPGACGRRRTP